MEAAGSTPALAAARRLDSILDRQGGVPDKPPSVGCNPSAIGIIGALCDWISGKHRRFDSSNPDKDHGALDVTSIPVVMKVVSVGLAPWDNRDQGLPATVPPARIKTEEGSMWNKLDGEAKAMLIVFGGFLSLVTLYFVCGWRP